MSALMTILFTLHQLQNLQLILMIVVVLQKILFTRDLNAIIIKLIAFSEVVMT